MNAFSPAMFLQAGGPLVIFLLLCFVVALAMIAERLRFFQSLKSDSEQVWAEVQSDLLAKKYDWILQKYAQPTSPARFVVQQILLFHTDWLKGGSVNDFASFASWKDFFDETGARSIQQQLPQLERFLNYLATMGAVAPFLGLLGTVFGIIRSFLNLGEASMSDLNAGIAEALVATAAGLIVAIPSSAAYNYFRKRIDSTQSELEILAVRLKEQLWKQR
jgi:biopolymer transport protein ExbB/TolQ